MTTLILTFNTDTLMARAIKYIITAMNSRNGFDTATAAIDIYSIFSEEKK